MEKFTVTVAVNVPAYAEIEVEAETQEQAEAMTQDEIDRLGFQAGFMKGNGGPVFKPEWDSTNDLRVVG